MNDEIKPITDENEPVVVDPNVQAAPIEPVLSSDSSTTESTTANSNASLENAEEVPNVGASPAESSPANDTSSSANPALQGAGIGVVAQGSQVGEAGNVLSADASGSMAASSATNDSTTTVDGPLDSSSGDLGNVAGAAVDGAPVAGGVVADGADSGNVPAGGVLPAATTSDSTDEPHPAISHLKALRRKIESGEAIIMADLLRLIKRIEESL